MSFAARMESLTDEYKDRLRRVRNSATMKVVNEAQTPVASGGNMPVKTGNLRGSIAGRVGDRPSTTSGSPASALASAALSDLVFIGWTANYSLQMEARYGFARLATANWRSKVEEAAREVR